MYTELYILVVLFCITLVVSYAIHSRIGMGDTTPRRYFAGLIYTLIIYFLSDVVWACMSTGLLPQIRWLGVLVSNVYFISITVASYLWFLYMTTLLNSQLLASTRNKRIASILVIVHVLLCIYNLFNPILFGISEDFVYFHGPLFMLQYALCYLYLVSISIGALVKAFQRESYIERGRYLIVALFPILPAISGILQMIYPYIPFNAMAFTLNLTIIYMNELSQQVSQEPLTQLSNRKQLLRMLDNSIETHEYDGQLYLFMMDLDRFKSINDTFGHTEGDNALIATSNALKRAVNGLRQRATLARYGGDEFAIIAYFTNPEEVEAFKQTIQDELAEESALIEKDYTLNMSIGYAQYTPEMKGFKRLIEVADASLYAEKRRRKQEGII